MGQEGAIFKKGETYIRHLETGNCYPYHEETARLVQREEAEFVVWDGTEMLKIRTQEKEPEQPEPKNFAERVAQPKAVIKKSDPPKLKKALGPPPAKPRVDLSVPAE